MVIVAYVGSNDSVKQEDFLFLGRVVIFAVAYVGDLKGRLYATVDFHGDPGV